MEMRKIDRFAIRKLKETHNFGSFLKLIHLKPTLIENNGITKLYNAIRKPEMFFLEHDGDFDKYLEKNGIKFLFS